MDLPQLENALRSVPFLATLGVRVEDARPGTVVLRLPAADGVRAHGGSLHNAAVFALGETTAAVAVATHPRLAPLGPRQKSAKIKYYAAVGQDVTAHATIHGEQLAEALDALATDDDATMDVVVQVLDAHGSDVAEVTARFALSR